MQCSSLLIQRIFVEKVPKLPYLCNRFSQIVAQIQQASYIFLLSSLTCTQISLIQ
jgi:hypothetical protein